MTAGLATFAKVRALHDRTTNPGERAAAATRMQTLAQKAGMTVEQAVSKLDAPKPKPKTQAQATADALNEFFNRPEFVAQRVERERERQVRRAELLARYGSVEAVYAETEREAALRVACEPMTVWDQRPNLAENYTLDGWDWLHGREKVPPRVRAAVASAWPLPQTVDEAWAEYIAAEEHERDRQTMCDDEHFPALWAEVRRYVVEDLLDTLPAASIGDMLVRQSWLEHLNDQGFTRDVHRDAALLATLRADIERMGERLHRAEAGTAPVQDGQQPHQDDGLKSQPIPPVRSGHGKACSPGEHSSRSPDPEPTAAAVQSGQRPSTRAERRAAALALLEEGLTDREVARRLGISPTTAGTIRRTMRGQGR